MPDMSVWSWGGERGESRKEAGRLTRGTSQGCRQFEPEGLQ